METMEAKGKGDYVYYGGKNRKIQSVRVRGIAAPLYRLAGVQDGLTSHELCQPTRADAEYVPER